MELLKSPQYPQTEKKARRMVSPTKVLGWRGTIVVINGCSLCFLLLPSLNYYACSSNDRKHCPQYFLSHLLPGQLSVQCHQQAVSLACPKERERMRVSILCCEHPKKAGFKEIM
ncbi:uncharacterized protein LOC129291000 [Prosopis cineraria]|uniref:uncharacterized protein LOC129291000 n=1 Tax=Prosopis cineraria TaxID=364024 RepID=UPI0024105416|nr:uncharacterized protein LOC129291000 [Prosopis cineraria]